jgi:predicted amidohydrolase
MNAPVKIACIQMAAEFTETEQNLAHAEELILEACANGANLLILPEVFNVNPTYESRAEVYTVAEPVPEGFTTQKLMALAKAKGVYICGSLLEQDGVDLYNTSILVGPEGLIGKYRKLHQCGAENYYLEPGDLGIPVFHTAIGKIALLICLDAYYPETFRIAALQGADIVCVSFASDEMQASRGLPEPCHTIMPALCMANAVSNHMYIVGCNRAGSCHGKAKGGQSIIANHWGAPVVPIAPHDKEAILYAQVDLCDSRRKHFTPVNSRLANRRTDVYSPWLGYEKEQYLKQ